MGSIVSPSHRTDKNSVNQSGRGRKEQTHNPSMANTMKTSKKRVHHKELKDGIVGLKNNSLYCYMNACLQCILTITEMRDYYMNEDYRRFHEDRTVSNSNGYSRTIGEFFAEFYG